MFHAPTGKARSASEQPASVAQMTDAAYVASEQQAQNHGVECMKDLTKLGTAEILRVKRDALRQEHRDLDEAIRALEERNTSDQFTVRRLKKQKLALKEKIVALEDQITPDIIA